MEESAKKGLPEEKPEPNAEHKRSRVRPLCCREFGGGSVYEINANKQIAFICVYRVYVGQGVCIVLVVRGGEGGGAMI